MLILYGQCHVLDISLRSKNFNEYFLCMRWSFSRPFKSFSLPYTIINFLFASLKLLTNFENAYWNLLRILFSLIGRCSLLPISHWLQGKCTRINAASGTILQNHRRLPVSIFNVKIAAFGSYSGRGGDRTPKWLCCWTVSTRLSPPFFDSSMLLILIKRNLTWDLCSHWQGSELPKSRLSHRSAPLASSSGTFIFHMFFYWSILNIFQNIAIKLPINSVVYIPTVLTNDTELLT